jgi:hypothetical protein
VVARPDNGNLGILSALWSHYFTHTGFFLVESSLFLFSSVFYVYFRMCYSCRDTLLSVCVARTTHPLCTPPLYTLWFAMCLVFHKLHPIFSLWVPFWASQSFWWESFFHPYCSTFLAAQYIFTTLWPRQHISTVIFTVPLSVLFWVGFPPRFLSYVSLLHMGSWVFPAGLMPPIACSVWAFSQTDMFHTPLRPLATQHIFTLLVVRVLLVCFSPNPFPRSHRIPRDLRVKHPLWLLSRCPGSA